MTRSPRRYAHVQSTVDRFAWPVVLLLLLFAITTVGGAVYQSENARKTHRHRDDARAAIAARFAADYVRRRTAEQADFLTANADGFQADSTALLQQRVEQQFLADSTDDVLAVIVTQSDGEVVVRAERASEPIAKGTVLTDMQAVARSAAGTGVPIVSGRLEVGDVQAYAHASPLSGVSQQFGAWVVLYSLDASVLGTYFELPRGDAELVAYPTLLDDRGRVMAGPTLKRSAEGIERDRVTGTTWQVAVPRTLPPQGLPIWVFALLLVGMLLLGAYYWLQEGTRRSLRTDAERAAEGVQRLYEFASRILHSRNPREQAEQLAHAVVEGTDAVGARVRVARDHDIAGIIAGVALPSAHVYRLAVTGPRGPVGEVLCYSNDERLDAQQRQVVQTMAAMAGAGMHTLMVLERERTQASELQRLDELRTNLLSTVAHELRSPLTAIKGVLGLLSFQGELSDKQREYVDLATERTDSLVDLIQDLFDCSLMDSGQLNIRPERCLATELLNGSLGAMATAKAGDLYLSATPNLKMTVDPLRFDQILNNLVTNAFRHGKPPVEVAIRPYADGACLIVSDNGTGIPAEERDQIFSKFYQSDSGNARLVEGAGLGLSLVLGLMRLHGGRVDVDSTRLDGRGARFSLYFPDVAQVPGHEHDEGSEPEDELAPLRQII